jgi:hypothetical protein
LDIFKNNGRFDFILKDLFSNYRRIFSYKYGVLYVGNKGLSPHKARVLEKNKGIVSWYNSKG